MAIPKKIFVLHPKKYEESELEDAQVLWVAKSEEEAKAASKNYPPQFVWYEYDLTEEEMVQNPKIRPDLA